MDLCILYQINLEIPKSFSLPERKKRRGFEISTLNRQLKQPKEEVKGLLSLRAVSGQFNHKTGHLLAAAETRLCA